jgi:hypothetical protein
MKHRTHRRHRVIGGQVSLAPGSIYELQHRERLAALGPAIRRGTVIKSSKHLTIETKKVPITLGFSSWHDSCLAHLDRAEMIKALESSGNDGRSAAAILYDKDAGRSKWGLVVVVVCIDFWMAVVVLCRHFL